MIKATFCELDSHEDTCCFGNECQALYEIGQADVPVTEIRPSQRGECFKAPC